MPLNRTIIRAGSVFPLLFILAAAVTIFVPTSHAQEPQPQPPPSAAPPSAPPSPAPPPGTSAPPAGQVQGYTLTPAQEASAIAYAHARHELYFIDVAYGLLLLVLLLQLRVAPTFRDWANGWTEDNFGRIVVFTPLLLLTLDVLSLPTAIWQHHLAVQYQQSIQSWSSWFSDWLKGEGVEVAIGILLVWILYFAIRKSPRKWWFYFWVIAIPLIILGAIIEPLIVEPLFFKFTPLERSEPALAGNIERMTIRAGSPIPQTRIFEMAASAKLKSLNAYVTGLGASKRVVIWDTTIGRMTGDEVLFVTGHEMGHYVLGHVRLGIQFATALLLLFLYLSFRSLHWLLGRWGETWSIRGPDDLASLPVLLLLLGVFGFLSTPIQNAYSRHLEHQADQFGLEVIHGLVTDAPVVAAHAFQVLGEVDLEAPSPSTAVKMWFYNHPPLDERMRFAQTYNPWAGKGEPEFVK